LVVFHFRKRRRIMLRDNIHPAYFLISQHVE
jgi:hypothetical protein